MACGGVVVHPSDFFLELIHLAGKKLYRTAAFRAHHVMMAAPIVLMLESRDTIVESHLTGQTAFRQQFKRPVNRRVADARIFFLHQAVQFIGRKMVAGLEEGSQNRVALSGLFEPDPL